MNCQDIVPGMLFDLYDQTWEVVEEGNYAIVNGRRIDIANPTLNKWWCKPIAPPDAPLLLCCFDQIIEGAPHNPATPRNFRLKNT